MNKIEVIFEDDYFLFVNKPPNLLTLPDRFLNKPNLYQILQKKYDDLFIVHRLDKGTSGAIGFAKNLEAHRNLNLLFQNRNIGKFYTAIVSGN